MVNFNDFNDILKRDHNTSSLQNLSAAINAATAAINNVQQVPTDYSDAYAGVALLTTDDQGDVVDQTTADRKSVADSVLASARHSLATTREAIVGRYGQSVIATQADYQFKTVGERNRLATVLRADQHDVLQGAQVIFKSYGVDANNVVHQYELETVNTAGTDVTLWGSFDIERTFTGIVRLRVQLFHESEGTRTSLGQEWLYIPVSRHDGAYVQVFPDGPNLSGLTNAKIYHNSITQLQGLDNHWAAGWLTLPAIDYDVFWANTPTSYALEGSTMELVLLESYGTYVGGSVPFQNIAQMVQSKIENPSTEILVEDVVHDHVQDIDDLITFLDDNVPE